VSPSLYDRVPARSEHAGNSVDQVPTATKVPADQKARLEFSQQSNVLLGYVSDHYVYSALVIRDETAKRATVTCLLKSHSEKHETADRGDLTRDFSAARNPVDALRVVVPFKIIIVISLYDENRRNAPCIPKKFIEFVDVDSLSGGQEIWRASIPTPQCPHSLPKIVQ
jgi:hypothetical protein